MAFVYRRGNGSVVDPSRAVTNLVRETLGLGAEARISVMQMTCGCPEPGCGEVETQITFARSGQEDAWERLRIGKAMRDVTPEDLRAAIATDRRPRAAVAGRWETRQ